MTGLISNSNINPMVRPTLKSQWFKTVCEAENGEMQTAEYQGMSPVNTAPAALSGAEWHSGIFYQIS